LLEPEMLARKATIAVVPVLGLVFATGALDLDSFLAMILHCCCAIYIEKKSWDFNFLSREKNVNTSKK
jgi:hypothetical protein